ncbi:hypothetical protein IFM89_008018 [Coptis chinensis]|uniref:Uncharacterized protein n=1 Tax=Coptis chinensis TaxID=261450 RepID=A0A835HSH6_9MAGN|nr:hypothetical protein IFM89_008018 [Coptis chinensis]
MKVWNLSNCKLKSTLVWSSWLFESRCRFTFTMGRFVQAIGKDGVTLLWDLVKGRDCICLIFGGIIYALCFSPNRYWLCAGPEDGIKIWDLESKRVLVDLRLKSLHKERKRIQDMVHKYDACRKFEKGKRSLQTCGGAKNDESLLKAPILYSTKPIKCHCDWAYHPSRMFLHGIEIFNIVAKLKRVLPGCTIRKGWYNLWLEGGGDLLTISPLLEWNVRFLWIFGPVGRECRLKEFYYPLKTHVEANFSADLAARIELHYKFTTRLGSHF